MKRFFSFLAAAAMLFSAACSNDDSGTDGDQAVVSFSMTLDNGATKADPIIGKGTLANQLRYSVFEIKKNPNGELIESATTHLYDVAAPISVAEFPYELPIRLAKNKTYRIVFWAQNDQCGAYTYDRGQVSISYDGYNNDEARDAFFAYKDLTVTGSIRDDVTLKRPFAQLNVGVVDEDWNAAVATKATPLRSKVTVSEVANKIDLFTGKVSNDNNNGITYRTFDIPTEMLMVEVDPAKDGKEEFHYLSMSYLLVNDQNTEDGSGPADVKVDFEFETETPGHVITLNVPTVPLQRNHRTNILGQILTGTATFEIKIDAEFDTDINLDEPQNNIVLHEDYAEVNNLEGFMKWCYIVNNEADKLGYGLKLNDNIILPAKTIELDAANKTYKFTDTDITVTNGVPSGSNWIVSGMNPNDLTDGFSGHIDGQGHSIKGLRIAQNSDNHVGFVGLMYDDASIKNLTFEDAVVSGGERTGIVAGRAQNGTTVENVHVKNSSVTGTNEVGGIVGRNYRRLGGSNNYTEKMAYIKNCSTDKDTKVICNGSNVGGICGYNYGAVIINCVNNADVTGTSAVGGVVGYSRDYYYNADGYVIACGSTSEATITATNGNAGGVVGYGLADDANHINTENYIVACYSMSTISANKSAVILGSSTNTTTVASMGAKNGTTKACAGTVNSVFAYDNAAAVTQADVDAMNQAIANYNAIAGIEQTCPYTWQFTSGNWPTLK